MQSFQLFRRARIVRSLCSKIVLQPFSRKSRMYEKQEQRLKKFKDRAELEDAPKSDASTDTGAPPKPMIYRDYYEQMQKI